MSRGAIGTRSGQRIETLLRERGSRWKAAEQKLFRSVFTQKDPDAAPVAAIAEVRKSEIGENPYEPDPDLRDFENIPLKEDIDRLLRA